MELLLLLGRRRGWGGSGGEKGEGVDGEEGSDVGGEGGSWGGHLGFMKTLFSLQFLDLSIFKSKMNLVKPFGFFENPLNVFCCLGHISKEEVKIGPANIK